MVSLTPFFLNICRRCLVWDTEKIYCEIEIVDKIYYDVNELYLLINLVSSVFRALITFSHIVLLSLSYRPTICQQSFCFCMSAIISFEGQSRTKEGPRSGCGPFAQPMAVMCVGGNVPEPVTVFPVT